MKIAIVIPSNNKKEINGFIKSFSKLKSFKEHCRLIIVGNGDLCKSDIEYNNSVNIRYWQVDEENRKYRIISFAYYRWVGMMLGTEVGYTTDFSLFLDDDNRFPDGSDIYFMNVLNFLKKHPECSVLQAERKKANCTGYQIKYDGFYWTGYGLFIKNNLLFGDFNPAFEGCCEETLFAYNALNKEGIPYIYYGNPTYRDKSKPPKWNEENHPSYSEEVIQANIQGYIQRKYEDPEWRYYANIPHTRLPNLLDKKVMKRIKGIIKNEG